MKIAGLYNRNGDLIGEKGMMTRLAFYQACEIMIVNGVKHRDINVASIVSSMVKEMSQATFWSYWDSADQLILEIHDDWIRQNRFVSDRFYHMAHMIRIERK